MLEDLQPEEEEEVNCSEICLLIEGVINCRLNDRDRAWFSAWVVIDCSQNHRVCVLKTTGYLECYAAGTWSSWALVAK